MTAAGVTGAGVPSAGAVPALAAASLAWLALISAAMRDCSAFTRSRSTVISSERFLALASVAAVVTEEATSARPSSRMVASCAATAVLSSLRAALRVMVERPAKADSDPVVWPWASRGALAAVPICCCARRSGAGTARVMSVEFLSIETAATSILSEFGEAAATIPPTVTRPRVLIASAARPRCMAVRPRSASAVS